MKTYLLLLPVVLLIACDKIEEPKDDFEHIAITLTEGEEDLYSIPHDYHGLIQSPVNILTTALESEKIHDVSIVNPHCHAVDVVNTGHSVLIDFEKGTEINFDNMSYEFRQAHFHTPSEHQIDGITYPMELHFVNYFYDSVKNSSNYLVIAVLFKMGQENPFIEKFINLIPEHAHDTASLVDVPIYLDDLNKPSHVDEYDWFHYKGSLTTNPYTETVNWLIIKDIHEASPSEITRINMLEGNNARHIQALYDRGVEE